MGIESDWNSGADKFNQWEELGKEEVAEFADKQIEILRAQLEIAVGALDGIAISASDWVTRNEAQAALTKIKELE